jgi:putative ABC transport system ATP-binding protein
MADAAILEARDLVRVFEDGEREVNAVRSVSLVVNRADFIALIGPSGCGKSTLLSLLGLIDIPTSGEIVFEGVSLRDLNDKKLREYRRARIGYVFQSFNLLSTLTVEENVMLPCILNGWMELDARKRAHDILDTLGLSHRLKVMPATLSGGETQRVAIARAVARPAALLIADEPTGNLDSVSGAAVLSLLEELNRQGTPIIMATHSESSVARCNRVIRMRDGVIVDAG